MNIFFVDRVPGKAAEALCDKHVVKMTLETCQLLCTAHRLSNIEDSGLYDILGVYKATHINHPCSKWVRASIPHYSWTYQHFIALLQEYNFRYEKTHACNKFVTLLVDSPVGTVSTEWNEPPQCMPDQYKIPNDTIAAYRNYYRGAKKDIATWKIRSVPSWFHD